MIDPVDLAHILKFLINLVFLLLLAINSIHPLDLTAISLRQ